MSKAIKKIIPIAAPIAGSLLLPGIGTALGASISAAGGAAIGGGLGSLATGGSIKDALISGAGSYVGGKVGGNLFPKTIGQSIGFDNAANVGGSIADVLGGRVANNVINTSIGSALGSMYGGSMAKNAFSAPDMPKAANTNESQIMQPFKASREAEQEAPASLSGMGALNPMQRSTNIANQGVYGGGAGPQEEGYFLNQVNRRLVDDTGNVDADFSDLSPIEMSYLDRLGMGGHGNATSLLEAITRKRAAA